MPKIIDAAERFGTEQQTCRCGRWPQRCATAATAEDLLCEFCRDGMCRQLTAIAADGDVVQVSHVRVTYAITFATSGNG